RTRDDQHLGAVAPEGRQRVGHDARRAARVLDGQEAPAEPFDLLLQRGLEARALLGVEALLRHHADRRRPEAVDGHQAARGAGDLLDGGDRLGGGDERRNPAPSPRLARLDRLRVEQREDRDAFERVGIRQREAAHAQEPPARRRERPLAARVALHLDAVAHDDRGQPLAGFFLVQVVELDDQQVNLLPRRLEQGLRARRGETGTLLDRDLPRPVADVVTEHPVDQPFEGRRLATLGDRLHWSGVRESGSDRGWPAIDASWRRGRALIGMPEPPARTAWISAMTASAISGADLAPMSRPIGTRMRFSDASFSPSSTRSFRMAAPRRWEPSMPM